MKRTISIRLSIAAEQQKILFQLQDAFRSVCNEIVRAVVEHHCWNRVALHHFVYHQVRKISSLGSQMICNAIFAVCKAYKAKSISKEEPVPTIQFHKNRSVHFDKR